MRWPFTRYGTRELAVGAGVLGALTALAAWLVPWASAVPAGLLALVLWFFRDPERTPPEGEAKVLSPADGVVADIQEVREEDFLRADAVRVGIFMSLFNVHVNRVPVSGRVVYRDYRPGKFHPAMSGAASAQNECSLVGIESADGTRVLVRQIAGVLARRIVCACAEGETVERGRRFGMVKLGSRLEVCVPRASGFRLGVRVGDRVLAGRSVLGELGSERGCP